MGKFGEWLEGELTNRGWDKAELARRAHTSQAQIGRIINGSRQVGPDVALSIARALGESPEAVFREAGFLPRLPAAVAEEQEMVRIVREQPPPIRRTILSMLRGLAGRRPLPIDEGIAEMISIYERTDPVYQPELVRAVRMAELNAHAGEPRIIGGESEQEWQPAPTADPNDS
ncbi:MAG: transcriptional regulator [Alphaproteobacteria bacterium]